MAAVAAAAILAGAGPAARGELPGYRRIVELESSRTYSSELVAALQGTDVRLAARAALALGRIQDARAAGPLRNAAGSGDVPLRALALYAYGLLAGHGRLSAEPVRRGLGDPAGAVRVAALDASWRLRAARVPGSGALSPALLHLAATAGDPIVRARAATALAGWGDAFGAAAVARALSAAEARERDATVRWHEAWTLRRAFAVLTPASTVARGLRDPDETVRIQFADLVARRGARPEVRLLEPLLRDPSWRVREQAEESIRVRGGGKRTAHLAVLPAGIVTPGPVAENTEAPLPRPADTGPPRRPAAADAIVDGALFPATSAAMTGPAPGAHPRVRLTTTQGSIVVRLYPEWAPLTVANFLMLAGRGYYDNLPWYRVVPDFVVQTGGHPTGKADGDVEPAGYTIPAEENPLEQRAGVLAMGLDYTTGANPGPKRDSANVEFYLTISPQLHLNRDFSVFGEIESGFPVLGRLLESDRLVKVDRLPDR